jgi:hypothetical protein
VLHGVDPPLEPEEVKMSDAHYSRYQQAAATAKERGLVVCAPAPNELFVDIDDAESLALFERNFPKLEELGLFSKVLKTESPSGKPGRWHVVVWLNRDVESTFERIALQALLGSDRVREVLSWQRATRGDPVPTLFFERPSDSSPEPSAPVEDGALAF